MKKIKLFSALALTLVMASCDNFDLPNPPGQSYPEPDAVFEDGDIELAPVSDLLDLTSLNNEAQLATVANVTKLTNFPEGYTLAVDMEVADDVEFSNPMTLTTTLAGDAVQVIPDVLNGAVQKVLSKKPGTYDLNARFVAYAVNGTTRMRLGGIDKTFCSELLKIKTFEATKVIEDTYYVIPCDASGTPNFGAAIKMANTNGEGKIGYDYPEFQVKIDSPEPDGMYVKIAPESVKVAQDASQLLGVNMTGELSGKLGTEYSAAKISITGSVMITINAESDAFDVSYALEALYPFNDTNKAADLMLLYTTDYMNYSGVTEIQNKVFFGSSTNKKKAPLFYQDEASEPSVSEDGLTKTGLLSNLGNKQIVTPVTGKLLYWVEINLPLMNYKMTALQTLSIVGNGNGWDEKNAPELTPSKDHKTWKATDIQIGTGDDEGAFKINANHTWDINFGGTAVGDVAGQKVFNLTMNGSDMKVEKGVYDVEVNFSSLPYTITLTKN